MIEAACLMINCMTLIILSFEDIKRKKVSVVPILILACFNLAVFICGKNEPSGLLTAVLPGAFSLLVSFCTKGKIGLGDGLILIAVGIVCGWERILAIWLAALVLSALAGIVLIIMKKADIKTALPFVPFILAGYASFEVLERAVGI